MEKSNLPMSADFNKIDKVKLATTCAKLKKKKNDDFSINYFSKNSTVSAVFTKNKFAAAPVLIAKKNLSSKKKHVQLLLTRQSQMQEQEKGLEDVLLHILSSEN